MDGIRSLGYARKFLRHCPLNFGIQRELPRDAPIDIATESGSGLPRLLQTADVEILRSGFIDESIVCGIVHLARSRQNPKVFPGWVAHERIRVIRRKRNDLIVSPDLWNKVWSITSQKALCLGARSAVIGSAQAAIDFRAG